MKKLSSAIFILAVVMLVSVLASLMPSDHWFIRTIDLVREPMSYLAAILLLIVIFVKSKTRWPATVILGLVIAINVWRIWPYSALAGTQVQLIERGAAGAEKRCYSALSANLERIAAAGRAPSSRDACRSVRDEAAHWNRSAMADAVFP